MGKLVSSLFRLARVCRDVEVVASGSPKKIGNRLVNKVIGRKIISRLWWR